MLEGYEGIFFEVALPILDDPPAQALIKSEHTE